MIQCPTSSGVRIVFVLFCLINFTKCSPPPVPRPKGYFRIELPKSQFSTKTSLCDVSLEIPAYSHIENIEASNSEEACWFNLRFPSLHARLHCTDITINDDFEKLILDAQDLVFNHEIKASGIRRIRVNNSESNLNGILYRIDGPVATPLQFFITDSTEHFLRGSLYFDHQPNSDSTAPVLTRLIADVQHIMRTVEWK